MIPLSQIIYWNFLHLSNCCQRIHACLYKQRAWPIVLNFLHFLGQQENNLLKHNNFDHKWSQELFRIFSNVFVFPTYCLKNVC